MNVLSIGDGISCGQLALRKANIKYDNYYSSEIDKFVINNTQIKFPNTIQLGNIKDVRGYALPKIDLLIGGTPCQSFSNAGRGGGFNGESGLFWEYVRVLKETSPTYFLLENVRMKTEWKDTISEALGVSPISLNSSLVSAQNRPRLYWTNIPNILAPLDKGIMLKDIIQTDVEFKFPSDRRLNYIEGRKNKGFTNGIIYNLNVKAPCLTAQMYKSLTNQTILDPNINKIRFLTPIEVERLQTIPDNHTDTMSSTQRYKSLGNAWTVDIISHIFSFIPNL